MRNKLLILLIGSYILAFSINLMPALKHPDLHADLLDLLVSMMFIALLLIYARIGRTKIKIFLSGGILSGVVVFFISQFEGRMVGNGILDAIVNIQYPFYLIFTTPLFGGNLLIDISYGTYSLLMSVFYAVVLGFASYSKKNYVQIV